MVLTLSQKLQKQAEIFGKLKSAFEQRAAEENQKEELMIEVCQGLHDVCLMLAEDAERENKQRS